MPILNKSITDKARGTTRALKQPPIEVVVYLSTEEIPAADPLHERLTISSPALLDADELRKLVELARTLSKERRDAMPYGQSAHSVNVIGPGAYPSATHPYISPDAFDNRQLLMKHAALVELPETIAWNDKKAVRRFMKKRSDEIDARLAKWHAEQRRLKLQKSVF